MTCGTRLGHHKVSNTSHEVMLLLHSHFFFLSFFMSLKTLRPKIAFEAEYFFLYLSKLIYISLYQEDCHHYTNVISLSKKLFELKVHNTNKCTFLIYICTILHRSCMFRRHIRRTQRALRQDLKLTTLRMAYIDAATCKSHVNYTCIYKRCMF
jgi:hypothetical protein